MKVGLFVTCPVDIFRPSVAEATVTLLEACGYQMEVPPQSCCGQVAFNNGEPDKTRQMAWQLITAFADCDYVVAPSGSCSGMAKCHYPELFRGDKRLPEVERFCDKVYELTTFLVEVAQYQPQTQVSGLEQRRITYHDSCAGLRELGIKQQPRELLSRCAGVEVTEMPETEVCCGFGGTFCVKFPEVSNNMVTNKLHNAASVQADMLLGGDLSCLLNIAGRAHRLGQTIEVRHVAEVLAGHLHTPAIGAAKTLESKE